MIAPREVPVSPRGGGRGAEGGGPPVPITAGLVAGTLVVLAALYLSGLLGLETSIRAGIAAVGLATLLAAARALPIGPLPPRVERRDDDPSEHSDGGRMRATESAIGLGERYGFDFYLLVHPRLSAVASRRLAEAGVDPRSPADTARALGSSAALVDPGAKAPDDRNAPGVTAGAVCELLRRLDGLR